MKNNIKTFDVPDHLSEHVKHILNNRDSIPRIGTINKLAEKDLKQLSDLKTYDPLPDHKSVLDQFFIDTANEVRLQYTELDNQFKRELDKIKFRGEITKEKIKRHGFMFIHQQEVGTYITKNGVRVTDIFFKPLI